MIETTVKNLHKRLTWTDIFCKTIPKHAKNAHRESL